MRSRTREFFRRRQCFAWVTDAARPSVCVISSNPMRVAPVATACKIRSSGAALPPGNLFKITRVLLSATALQTVQAKHSICGASARLRSMLPAARATSSQAARAASVSQCDCQLSTCAASLGVKPDICNAPCFSSRPLASDRLSAETTRYSVALPVWVVP